MKALLYSAEKLLQFCNVGAIKGGASGYEFGGVVWWCGFLGICTLRYSPKHPGFSVRVRCMRVRAVFNSTRDCFLILFADAMKRNFQGFDDEDCQVIPRY